MKKQWIAAGAAVALMGMAHAAGAAPKMTRTATSMYGAQSPQQAAAALVEAAKTQTDGGSW